MIVTLIIMTDALMCKTLPDDSRSNFSLCSSCLTAAHWQRFELLSACTVLKLKLNSLTLSVLISPFIYYFSLLLVFFASH